MTHDERKALVAGLESEKLLIPYGVSSFFLWQNMRKCEIIRCSNGLPVGALHLSQLIFPADI